MDGCLYKRKVIYQRRRLRAGDERMDGWMDVRIEGRVFFETGSYLVVLCPFWHCDACRVEHEAF
jgi:hypothetical protein